MAKFCARVRKRGDLPPVSMQDIYRHPTIRSLAAALALVAPRPAQPLLSGGRGGDPDDRTEYILCGALQACRSSLIRIRRRCHRGGLCVGLRGIGGPRDIPAFGSGEHRGILAVCAVPIAAKWVLVGRWSAQQIRLWSLAYVRFWTVKTLIRSSPAAVCSSARPVLVLSSGAGREDRARRGDFLPARAGLHRSPDYRRGTVIRKEAIFNGYRAQSGRSRPGR